MLTQDIVESNFDGKRVWVTGHRGMLGSAVVRALRGKVGELLISTRSELDLTDQSRVNEYVADNRPELIFHIGAKVGGIYANSTQPADFMRENLLIQTSVMSAAHNAGIQKLVFVASNCTYPITVSQPINEEQWLLGQLEENIKFYALSKIVGVETCRAYNKQYGTSFVSIIPPNLYGPGDNYHPEHSHVVAGILSRTHQAKVKNSSSIEVWGDGSPRRELLHVDDLAQAMMYVMASPFTHDLYNIGYGKDLAIHEIAELIKEVVGFNGEITFNTSKPNGSRGKLLDSSRIRGLGWRPRFRPKEGLHTAYSDYLVRLESGVL